MTPWASPSPSLLPCTPDDPKVGLGVGPSQIILSADRSTGSFTVYNGGNMDQAHEDWVRYEMTRPLDEWLGDRPLVKRIRAILAERLGVAATARRPWLEGRKT